MGILFFIIMPFIVVPAALYFHNREKEKQMQPYYEADSIATQEENCITRIDSSRLEDERTLLNSIIDYTQGIQLTAVQEQVQDSMFENLDSLNCALQQISADKEELRQKAAADRSYAEHCRMAAGSSSSGMEPFIILGGAFMLGIICTALGITGFGIGLILFSAFIGTPLTFGITAYLSERNVRIRHENGIYNGEADFRDHINTGIMAGFAAKSAYDSYRAVEDMQNREDDDE